MSWSECSVKIARTIGTDTIGSPLVSVGTIKDKSTTIEVTEGDKLQAKRTGGKLVAQLTNIGEHTLKTRVIEPTFEVIANLVGSNVLVHEAALQAATSIKIKKGSKALDNMYLTNGTQVAQVIDIDTTDQDFDLLTITLAAVVSAGDSLWECTSAGDLLVRSNIVPSAYSVEVTPKNTGAIGVRVRKAAVNYIPGWSEEEGHFADIAFAFMECEDGELYTQFIKP